MVSAAVAVTGCGRIGFDGRTPGEGSNVRSNRSGDGGGLASDARLPSNDVFDFRAAAEAADVASALERSGVVDVVSAADAAADASSVRDLSAADAARGDAPAAPDHPRVSDLMSAVDAAAAEGPSAFDLPSADHGSIGDFGLRSEAASVPDSSRTDGASGGGTCFGAGTPVTMAGGDERPIEGIRPGNQVLGYDLDRQQVVSARVLRVFVHPSTAGTLLFNGVLRVTPEHPFYADGSWRTAGSLTPGANLWMLAPDGSMRVVALKSVTGLDGPLTTYNLEVEGVHTYFAGGLLVHNKTFNGLLPAELRAGLEGLRALVEAPLATASGESTLVRYAAGCASMFAPQWRHAPCDEACQQHVSACVLARLNTRGRRLPIRLSARVSPAADEGAFFGNLFVDPPQLFSCSGGRTPRTRLGRECTLPGNRCGVTWTGPCSAACTGDASGASRCGRYRQVIAVRPPR